MARIFSKLSLGCLMLSCCAASVGKAQDPTMGYLFASGYGYGNFHRYHYNVPTPPYFALHPPVYYGERYERPYGVSPFAAWPQMQVNPAYQPRPRELDRIHIANPHASSNLRPSTGPVAIAPSTVHSSTDTYVTDNAQPGTTQYSPNGTVTILNPYATRSTAATQNVSSTAN